MNARTSLSDKSFPPNATHLTPKNPPSSTMPPQFTYQVVLQRIWPDVVLDDLPKLISSSISMIGEPSEEAFWLFVLPLPPCFVLRLAGALGQVLQRTTKRTDDSQRKRVRPTFDLKIKNAFIDADITDGLGIKPWQTWKCLIFLPCWWIRPYLSWFPFDFCWLWRRVSTLVQMEFFGKYFVFKVRIFIKILKEKINISKNLRGGKSPTQKSQIITVLTKSIL